MNKFYASSKSDDWATPKLLYNYIINDLKYKDPNPYKSKENMFYKEIKGNIFINPPFSQKRLFLSYAKQYFINGKGEVLLLLPTTLIGTKTFYEFTQYINFKMYIITGRLKYNDIGQAPFSSFLLKLDNKNNKKNIEFIEQEEIYKIKF